MSAKGQSDGSLPLQAGTAGVATPLWWCATDEVNK